MSSTLSAPDTLDDVDPFLIRRNAIRSRYRRKLIVAGIVSGVFLSAIAGSVVAFGGVGSKVKSLAVGQSESRDREAWTHRELVEFLNSNGVKCKPTGTIEGMARGTPMNLNLEDGSVVFALLCHNSQTAKDFAGAMPDTESFSSGRFYFNSNNKKSLNAVRDALK